MSDHFLLALLIDCEPPEKRLSHQYLKAKSLNWRFNRVNAGSHLVPHFVARVSESDTRVGITV